MPVQSFTTAEHRELARVPLLQRDTVYGDAGDRTAKREAVEPMPIERRLDVQEKPHRSPHEGAGQKPFSDVQ